MHRILNQVTGCHFAFDHSASKKLTSAVVLLAAMLLWGQSGVSHAADRVRPNDFISADFCAAIIIHPQRMAKSPLAKSLPLASLPALAGRNVPAGFDVQTLIKSVSPEKIERVILLIDPLPGGNVAFFPALIVQYAEDIDGAGVLSALLEDAVAAEHNGKSYQRGPEAFFIAKLPLCGHVADRRTVIFAAEPTIKKMLTAEKKNNRLLDRLKKTSFKHDVIIEFVSGPAVATYEKLTGKSVDEVDEEEPSEGLEQVIYHILKDVGSFSLALDLSGDTLLTAKMTLNTDEAADQMEARAIQGKQQVTKMFEDAGPVIEQVVPPELQEPINSLAKQVISGLSISRSGKTVSAVLPMPAALLELSRAAGKMITDAAEDKPDLE